MQYQRWFWIRIIQRYIGKIEDVDETWQTAIDKGQLITQHIFPDVRCTKFSKVEQTLKGSLGLIPSPSPSVKIQIIGRKVYLR